jgi:hypothetical protein
MEAAIPVPLSTAVQHALKSTNPVHAFGAADGPRRYGTRQTPSHPSRASMKCGPFPMWPVKCGPSPCGRLSRPPSTTTRSDCRSTAHPTSRVRRLWEGHRFPPPRRRRGRGACRVPRTTIRTFNAQIRRRVPQRPLLDEERVPWPWPLHNRLGTLLLRPKTAVANDAYSGFTRVADRAVDPAPLRTRPLDHARRLTTGDPGVSPDRTHTRRPS